MDGDQPICALQGHPQGQGGGPASSMALRQLYMTYCVVLLNLRHGVHSFRGRRVAQTDLQ